MTFSVLHVVSPRWPCVVLLLAACRSGEEEQDGRGKGRSTTEGARGGWFAVAWLFRVCVLFGVVSGFFVDILARDLRSQKGATAIGGNAFFNAKKNAFEIQHLNWHPAVATPWGKFIFSEKLQQKKIFANFLSTGSPLSGANSGAEFPKGFS